MCCCLETLRWKIPFTVQWFSMTQETTQKFINRANLYLCASSCTITEALLNEPCNKYFMDLVSLFSYWAVRNKSIMSSLLSDFIVSIEPYFSLCYNFFNYFTLCEILVNPVAKMWGLPLWHMIESAQRPIRFSCQTFKKLTEEDP